MKKTFLILFSMLSIQVFAQPASDSLKQLMEQHLVRKGKKPVHNFLLYASKPSTGFEFHEAAGVVGRNDQPVGKDFQFKIASITKTMVATLVLQLEEEGKLSLNDPAKKYLGHIPFVQYEEIHHYHQKPYADSITILHLLTHTSGIADIFGDAETKFYLSVLTHPKRKYTPQSIYSRYFKYKLHLESTNPPGQGYHYSDMNYMLLGFIVEEITGKPLHETLRERIFNPLNLKDTYFEYFEEPCGTQKQIDAYYGFINLTRKINTSYEWAGGGVISTTKDLALFSQALFEGELFQKQETLEKMLDFHHTRPFGGRYGLGVFQYDLDGDIYYGHGGFYGSKMLYSPDTKTTIVLNIGQSEPPYSEGKLLREIAKLIP